MVQVFSVAKIELDSLVIIDDENHNERIEFDFAISFHLPFVIYRL